MVYLFVKFGGQPRLQVKSTEIPNQRESAESRFFSPGFFGVLRRRFMPFEPVANTVHVDVNTDAHVSNHPLITRRKRRDGMGRRTYPTRHVSTERPSWGPRPVASTAHQRSSVRPSRTHLEGAVPPALYT
jgi:hypothetical protein